MKRKRVAANATNATTTMANLADLSFSVVAGRHYTFDLVLFAADDVAADGFKVDLDGGTATVTVLRAHGTVVGTTLVLAGPSSALATDFAAGTTTGDVMIEIRGAFTVNAAGTFIPRFAQNAHTTGTATVYAGSFLWLADIS